MYGNAPTYIEGVDSIVLPKLMKYPHVSLSKSRFANMRWRHQAKWREQLSNGSGVVGPSITSAQTFKIAVWRHQPVRRSIHVGARKKSEDLRRSFGLNFGKHNNQVLSANGVCYVTKCSRKRRWFARCGVINGCTKVDLSIELLAR